MPSDPQTAAVGVVRELIWRAAWFGALFATLAFGVLALGVLARVS